MSDHISESLTKTASYLTQLLQKITTEMSQKIVVFRSTVRSRLNKSGSQMSIHKKFLRCR